jgi:hypothetical protein
MVAKKAEKKTSKPKKAEKKKEKEEHGVSLDDAFADDEDVTYAETKPRKLVKKEDDSDNEEEGKTASLGSMDEDLGVKRNIHASKPIAKIKKGDKVKVDGHEYEVDCHYVLMDHGTCKEMAIELFDSKTDKDYQLRYFDDQAETTLDFYELDEILYNKRPYKKVEW